MGMNRYKRVMILVAAFCGICLAVLGVSRYEEQKEIIRNSDEIILEIASGEVKRLSWECDTGAFAFHRDEDGTWLYDEDEAFPVDGEKIERLLEQFQEFGVSFVIEEVEDWAQYGLDQPVCKIHMETESETCEVLLGGFSTVDSLRYVSIGNNNAYLVKEDPLDRFEIQISDLIRNDEIPKLREVTQMQFSGRKSESIVYEENSSSAYYAEDVWFMEQGEGYRPLDTSRVNDYLNVIEGINLKDYVDYNADEDDLAAYGLDVPELSVMIDYISNDEETDKEITETFILNIGRDPEEQREISGENEENADDAEEVTAYARAGESKIIYQISTEQYKALMDMEYNSLRHQEIFWADFEDVYQLTVLLEGNSYTFTSETKGEERTYFYESAEVETAGIRSAIRGLKAADYTDEAPTQKEEISLTIYLDNENYPEVHIQLFRYDGNHCIAVVDGVPVAFVERACAVELIEAVNTIVLE